MKTLAATTLLFTLASAHGLITDPPPRAPGPAFKAACGEQLFSTVSSDAYGNIQQLDQQSKGGKGFNAATCNLGLCKGLQFADTPAANVRALTAGQTVAVVVDIRAPHTGTANVSVVDTATNSMIGQPLMAWDVYASNAIGVQKNNTNFEITMPDVRAQCGVAGRCVVQWWWDSPDAKQTYESCVDFTMS